MKVVQLTCNQPVTVRFCLGAPSTLAVGREFESLQRHHFEEDMKQFLLVPVVIAVLCAVGWIMNLVTIYHSDFNQLTGQLIVRLIGVIFVPVGSVIGYF